jgi:anhydro-N-acetylmuramic acid kinase
MTKFHALAARQLLHLAGMAARDLAVVGFHGHTIWHRPAEGRTWQIGDGALLARLSGVPVVYDFRSADVAAGGQGAPLVPLYHAARAAGLPKPLVILNLGGVANLTWIGEHDALLAFDTGPGNALVDDWLLHTKGQKMDEGGRLAAAGKADEAALRVMLSHAYFAASPPKSLDRGDFTLAPVAALAPADGAATLSEFTARAVKAGLAHLPAAPKSFLVAGGGRHNLTMMAALKRHLPAPVIAVEAAGWHGDALEAEAFAFLAVRALEGLPLSLPTTTGVPRPMPGGRIAHPAA